jgi:CspA family cold shock protein
MALLSLAGYVVNALTRGLSHSQTVQSLNDQANELTKDIVLRVRLAQGAADRQRAVDLIGEEAVRLLRLLDDQRRLGLISYSDFEVRAEAIVLEALAAQQAVQSGSAIPEGQLRRNCPHCGGPVVGNDTNVCQHCGQSMLKNRCPKCGRFYYGAQASCQCDHSTSASSPVGMERATTPATPRETPTRVRGTVKWFNADEGHGFLSLEGGYELFVHCSEIKGNGLKTLCYGQLVECSIGSADNGNPMAVDVVRL